MLNCWNKVPLLAYNQWFSKV